jgi:glycosyltransferase involved in cell wall biosynthesis
LGKVFQGYGQAVKIVFAIKKMDEASGGAERVLATVTEKLAARGHKITLLSFDRNGESFYPLSPQVRRLRLAIGDARKPATIVETCRRIAALRKAVRAENPDAVVAFMHSMFIPVTFALAGTDIPVIASEHIVPRHYKARRAEFLLLIISMLMARRTTVLSEAVRNLYPSFLRPRMVVMPNPVLAAEQRSGPSGQDAKTKIILNVGRLDPQKDQAILIEAFSGLAGRYPDWQIRILGEGNLRPQLESRIHQLGLKERVHLPGIIRDIESEYARAHIFALPSRYESFGLATAEALSRGLPAVGFADCPGTNELIADGRNGILVKVRTAPELAAALETLMANPGLRLSYGQAGRQMLQGHDPDRVADLWEGLIRTVAGPLQGVSTK